MRRNYDSLQGILDNGNEEATNKVRVKGGQLYTSDETPGRISFGRTEKIQGAHDLIGVEKNRANGAIVEMGLSGSLTYDQAADLQRSLARINHPEGEVTVGSLREVMDGMNGVVDAARTGVAANQQGQGQNQGNIGDHINQAGPATSAIRIARS